MLVIFESDQCGRCAQFHRDTLADPQVRKRLAAFETVRLDARDAYTPVVTTEGVIATPKAWFEALGFTQLPALVWFNEQGNQVLKTDAAVGKGRMLNALGFVRDRAFDKGWTYQRYARSQAMRRPAESRDTTEER